MKPVVVITGRSNVGKSSLFNKIIESRGSIVLSKAGTTRDRIEAEVAWRDKSFCLVDTGGLDPAQHDIYKDKIIKQTISAQKKSSIILFVVDAKTGPLPSEKNISSQLKKTGKNIFLVINKCDNQKRRSRIEKFKTFNLPMFPVSSINGSGVGDLLDEIAKNIPKTNNEKKDTDITVALIGKPNVGKSSIFNALAREERMIVSEHPHTTRDSQYIIVAHKNYNCKIIDTAGIRRKTKQGGEVEKMSIEKSKKAIRQSDVVALIIDISQQVTSQEKRLAREIQISKKEFLIAVNKWDLAQEKNQKTANKYKTWIADNFPNLSGAPIVFTSAKNQKTSEKIISSAIEIHKKHRL